MKKINSVFDLFLYESIFAFLFSLPLGFLNDPVSNILFDISIVAFILSVVLSIAGNFLGYKKEKAVSDFE